MSVTTDLSNFGHRERALLEDILKAWREHGLPYDFDGDEVVPMFNLNSGYVFLTNSNFDVAMESDGKLESFYSCPVCGHEGLWEDMQHGDDEEECQEYLTQIKENREDEGI